MQLRIMPLPTQNPIAAGACAERRCHEKHHAGCDMHRAVQRIDDENAEEHVVDGDARHKAEHAAGDEAEPVEEAEPSHHRKSAFAWPPGGSASPTDFMLRFHRLSRFSGVLNAVLKLVCLL